MIRPEAAPLRLDHLSYKSLRQQILRRDGWRCQSCGTMTNLEVHHGEFRSHSGEDSEQNLITLCAACHAREHRQQGDSACFGKNNPSAGCSEGWYLTHPEVVIE